MTPKTQFARNGEAHIAYRVVGDGPIDLVYAPPWISNIEFYWDEPACARFLEGLASFSRLIIFDRRNTGSSDRTADPPSFEQQVDDIAAVMRAVGSERPALMGASEGGSQCAMFAATYPDRTHALILYGTVATFAQTSETPWGVSRRRWEATMQFLADNWGTAIGIEMFAPSRANDERFREWWARLLRLGASPQAAVANLEVAWDIDVRGILSTISVPTLVLHRSGDLMVPVESGRYLASKIPGARYVELPGDDHLPFVGDTDALVAEIEEFLTGTRSTPVTDRILATVLFTDIVGSTERAAELGDRRWRELLDAHDAVVARNVERFRGRVVKTTGDGALATFDGPARAISCAREIRDGVRALGIEVRVGLHTGEVEVRGEDLGGIAVHIGARVAAQAAPGDVLVSSSVPPLVAGSGIEFEDRGEHSLKGVPGDWRLFAVGR